MGARVWGRLGERRGAREGDGIALCGNAFAMRAWAPWVRGGASTPGVVLRGSWSPWVGAGGGGHDPQGQHLV